VLLAKLAKLLIKLLQLAQLDHTLSKDIKHVSYALLDTNAQRPTPLQLDVGTMNLPLLDLQLVLLAAQAWLLKALKFVDLVM